MKRKIIWSRFLILIAVVLSIFLGIYFLLLRKPIKKIVSKDIEGFVASNDISVKIYDGEFKETTDIIRGKKIKINDNEIKDESGKIYYKIKDKDIKGYILKDNFTKDEKETVLEKEMYVRTYLTVYKNLDNSEILSTINKGEKLDIIGFDKLLDDGTVNKYQIKYNDITGYVYGKYLVKTKEEAILNYDEDGLYQKHLNCNDVYDIGTAGNLDFYPVNKPKFENNVMPSEVRALYLNSGVISNVDKYIELAKKTDINAFVVDIKDNTAPGYESPVMQKYSKTSYDRAINSFENYQKAIRKIKDAGFYVIGRITVFKDSYFVTDHPETAIIDTSANKPFLHNGSYWPSAFNRLVWEYNVELAKEAVTEMGFNEIQFDYVRFPDRTYSYEKSGEISMQNTYGEEKAQAIQKFLMYASDEIHSVGAYISADVFGESAHNYVTGYGQYWPAISNVVDVISAMPYPDHFGAHEYGISEVVWTVPYKLFKEWGEYVVNRQNSIPTPAVVRTWIQCYDATKTPKITYDASKIEEQIKGLVDSNLTGGYMTWNAGSSLSKYESVKDAFKEHVTNE